MPTTNPVPSQDPSDLLFNAGKLDEVLNGTGTSFTDRLGTARRTVAGMNADFDAQLADAESDLNVYRADAAASSAQALGYLNTIRTTSYGAYASDPATDPLGNPPNVGDEYFNTTSNLLKRFNGTTWQASDINTANLAAPSGSSLVGYLPTGTGAVSTTVQSKLLERVTIKDFGAIGNGSVDDTQAVLKALASGAKKVVVTADTPTPLLTSPITVNPGQVLELECGGKNSAELPPVRFIKASSMTSAAIVIDGTGRVVGGGLECQSGNTGDGIILWGNSAQLIDFKVKGAGRDGVRIGVDVIYRNINSCYLQDVVATYNGRHGIYAHDGSDSSAAAGAADANLGVMLHCEGAYNGGDGIRLGRAWWWSLISCHGQVNGGWGLNLSGTVTAPDTVAECRYANVFGGDFNESNISGSANIAGYAATVFMASSNQVLNVTGTFSNLFGGGGDSVITGAKIGSFGLSASNGNRLLNFDGTNNALTYNANIPTTTLGTASQRWDKVYSTTSNSTNSESTQNYSDVFMTGRGANGTNAAPYAKDILQLRSTNASSGNVASAGIQGVNEFSSNSAAYFRFYTTDPYGVKADRIEVSPYGVLRPMVDNTQSLGTAATRWSVVYAGTGAINTSDKREKQQIRTLTDAERAVAVRCKGLIRAFKFNDSVEFKGDKARIHFGVIAQEVKAAFEAEGLVAEDYAVLCHDEWQAKYDQKYETVTTINEDGEEIREDRPVGDPVLIRPAGERYGVRYDELLAFIIAAL